MTIRAVLFDIDGVLLDSREANVAWYRDFLAKHGYSDLKREDLERGHYYSLKEAIAFLTKAPEDEVLTIFEIASALEGYPYELLQLPEGCAEVVTSLSQKYATGVVSSRLRAGIEHFYGFSGLGEHFQVAIGYEDTEQHKPEPEPLLTACARLGIEPSETVYIGDAVSDYACATAAGTHFIAYGDAVPDAEHRTTSFREIEAMIEALG